jgi:hypothetical protein
MIPAEAALLRVYVNAGDHWRGAPRDPRVF